MPTVDQMVSTAKGVLAGAKAKNFPASATKAPAVRATPSARPAATAAVGAPAANAASARGMLDRMVPPSVGGGPGPGTGVLGVMHEGGKVPKTGNYRLEKGETVTPASKSEGESKGRNSEYRKVYVARRQARSGGGNAPVKESAEKHDQKKAEKAGQPEGKKAGAHVKA